MSVQYALGLTTDYENFYSVSYSDIAKMEWVEVAFCFISVPVLQQLAENFS